jgi:phosphoribosylglycinamide formyltransferase-1
MRIGLITYERGHLKTEQVATGLAAPGRHALEFHALPFNPRPGRRPLFDHRPDQFAGCAPTADLARRLGARFTPCASEAEILAGGPAAPDIWMVMIGVLLSADFLARARVINCHAGVVPSVRGLDAFKWAILDDQPLGVTLHYVDAEVDAGEVIAVVPTDVRPNDTIADLARRHYDNEIAASIAFEAHVAGRTNPFADVAARPPRMRMNNEIEGEMLRRFPDYRDRWAAKSG